MAKEKVFSEVLNLRIEPAMAAEIRRVAGIEDRSDSDTARLLIGWGIAAHRDMEAKLLQRAYDDESPPRDALRVNVSWVDDDLDDILMGGSPVPQE